MLVLAVSLLAGAALLVTLVDVELFAQTVLGTGSAGAAAVLLPFLAALPIGALIGGALARRVAERWLVVAGMAVAAVAYLLMSTWSAEVRSMRLIGVPALVVHLLLAGLGLGLVIAPLAAIALRMVAPADHGAASAQVVVARTAGMLIGVAALTGWGLFRFNQLTASLNTPLPVGVDEATFAAQLAEYQRSLTAALVTEYTEIFLITAVLCAGAAILACWLPGADRAAVTEPHLAGETVPDA